MNYALIKNACLILASLTSSTAMSASLNDLKLNPKTKVAIVRASCATFLNNEFFSHPSKPGYVIKILGDNEMFEGLPARRMLTLEGTYRINSRGFAPQLIINNVEISKSKTKSNKSTPSTTNLKKVASAINTSWLDNNISTGTTHVHADAFNYSEIDIKSLKSAATDIFIAELKAQIQNLTDELANSLKIKSKVVKHTSREQSNIVKALMASNDYSPDNTESKDQFRDELDELTKALGSHDDIILIHTKAKIPNNGEEDDMRNVDSIILVNSKTKLSVHIFTIEGRI